MSDKGRILFFVLIFSLLIILTSQAYSISLWQKNLQITITPQRPASFRGTDAEFLSNPTYMQGEQATFNVTFRYVFSRWGQQWGVYTDIPEKHIRATFPNPKAKVKLRRRSTGVYIYTSPVLVKVGNGNHTLKISVKISVVKPSPYGLLGLDSEPQVIAQAQSSISVALRPLNIEITSPADGAIINTNSLQVSGTIDDSNVEVTVNGISASINNNQFSVEVPVVEGENTITATAENQFGTTDADSITVTIDTIPPGIAVNSPLNGSTVTETPITVTGTVDDPEASITVNGLLVVNSSGSFIAEGIPLVLGENEINIIAVDSAGNVASTTISVVYEPSPPEEIPESGFITGDVYHARTLAPLSLASIRVNGIDGQVLTDGEGRYRFPINEFPECNTQTVEIIISKPGFTTCYRKAEVTCTRRTYVDPVYLTPVDPEVTVIQPDPVNEQHHISADGTVELIFPPGSVPQEIEVTATNFQDSHELPEELPSTSFFTYCVDLQPGVEFNEPVTLRVANELGFEPGTEIPIGIYNEETLRWEDTGWLGTVTDDGQWVEAQIQHFTPLDCNFPPPQESPPGGVKQQTSSVQNPDKEAIVPGCRISIKTGNFSIDHNLPGIRILGIPQSLSLTYSSSTANPNILIDTEVYNDPLIITPPNKIKWELSVEGLHQERYFGGASGNLRFPYLYNCHNSDGGLLPTGRYSYSVDMSNVYTNETYWTADSFGGPPIMDTGVPLREPLLLTTRQEGRFIVNNQKDSPFGSGWGISGLQRLYFNPDGSILLTDGNGTATSFNQDIFLCYVAKEGSWWGGGGEVVVINQNNSIIDIIGIGGFLRGIAITPDRTRAYVVSDDLSDNVSVIDTDPISPAYHTVIDTIGFGGAVPGGIAITPDGTRAYVANYVTNNVSVIDTNPASPMYNTGIGAIGSGGHPVAIAITPDGTRAYVANYVSNNVSVIDTDPASPVYHTVIDTIGVGMHPRGIAITPDGTRAYVSKHLSVNVPVIDIDPASPAYHTVIDTIVVGEGPHEVAITPDGTRAYVSNYYSDNVSVIDTNPASPAYHTVIDTIGVGEGPLGIAITPDGTYAYVANNFSDNVSVIDTDPDSPAYHTVIDTIEVGEYPLGIVITPFSFPDIFLPEVGESSYLIQNPDNTYTRFYKDGTRVNFNEEGIHTSTVDRNGNTIGYTYDEQGRLITATYPQNQTYTFQYNPDTEKLTSITDPAGRITQTQIDGDGNLIQITNPDGTMKQYAYDDSRLMTGTTNTIGQTYQFEYDEYGKIQQTIDPEITVLAEGVEQQIQPQTQFQPADVQNLINDLPPDIGIFDNPAPIIRPGNIQAQVTDPRDNSYTAYLDRFGSFLTYTDSLGRTTQFTRDRNGNPTRIIRPNGTEINLTFDRRSNLTSYTEYEIDIITTLLTYNLEFSQVKSITDPLGNQTTLDYDDQGNPITITDALGNETNITWDGQGKPLTSTSHLDGEDITTTFTYYPATGNLHTITNPEGETTTITYDDAGNITEIEDALGRVTHYIYNLNNNRLTHIEDALGNTTQYQYDNTGNVTQITDANDNIIHFGYNELGQLIGITNPLGLEKHFWYDPAGNLVKIRNYNGDEITYVYDEVNRLVEKHWPGGEITTYSYNNLDNLTNITNPASQLEFNYDPVGRGRLIQAITLAGEHQPGTTIDYTYDNNGNRLTLNEPTLGTLIYTWDALNRLQQLRDFNGRIATFSYDLLSRRDNLNIPDILTSTYQYDNASRLLSVIASASEAISYSYTYNPVGNRTSFTEPLGVHNYEYDNIDQLIQATHPVLPEENFTYDTLGNRNPLTHTYNIANRLLSVIASGSEAISYTYDANGNRITKEYIDTGEVTTYDYNVENQLTQVDLPDGTVVNYYYDGLGRRIEKNVAEEITRYIYDGMDILAEFNGANELIRSYVHGPSVDEPLQTISYQPSAISYYYISDGLGSITAVIDGAGNIVEQYRYDAFGNTTILNAADEEIPESAVSNRYMFTAREYDTETDLYYYRLRYYDPLIGRFLQEDPVGYLLGPNLYTYVNNNPVNWVDPWGLARIGSRPLDEDKIPDWINGRGRIRHDQIWYDDGSSDSGFFGDDTIRSDLVYTRDQYDFSIDTKYYDDNLMHQAEENVQRNWDMDWRMGWKLWDWNNCQDYTCAVRDEYNRLELEQNIKQEQDNKSK